jgi:hypothetical protein
MRRQPIAAGSLAAAACVLFCSGSAAQSTAGTENLALTARGSQLWHFEALLRDTFGTRPVCVRSGNFVSERGCAPLAVYSPYFFTFAQARDSGFSLTRLPPGFPGNKAEYVRVKNRGVACGGRKRRYLIRYFTAASFTVDCPPVR